MPAEILGSLVRPFLARNDPRKDLRDAP